MVRLVQRPPLGAGGLIASWPLCGLANQATGVEPGRAVAVAASGLEQSRAMTRGNQRELARSKNMKKQADKGKRRDDGLSAAARKQRDSEIMQQKQKAAKEKKEELQQQQPK